MSKYRQLFKISAKFHKEFRKSLITLELFATTSSDEIKFYTSSIRYIFTTSELSSIIDDNRLYGSQIKNKFFDTLELLRVASQDDPLCEKYVYMLIDIVNKYRKCIDDVNTHWD